VREIVIGTRGSDLALWQANFVLSALTSQHAGLRVGLEVIRTKGDRALQTALHKMPDKGLFTREIENALLGGSIDLAVHSLKDLPIEPVDGLVVGAITAREDPADALVAKEAGTLDTLPRGAVVLTGSLRRRAQVLHRRADLKVRDVRGNVGTRLRKLAESDAAAIVLARAGLVRLGLSERITERLDPTEFLPACGQGALAIEIRRDDALMKELIEPLADAKSHAAVTAERALLAALGGGCRAPVGACATVADRGAKLTLTAMVANLDGSRLLRGTMTAPFGDTGDAEALGQRLADKLREDGCQEILDQVAGQLQDVSKANP